MVLLKQIALSFMSIIWLSKGLRVERTLDYDKLFTKQCSLYQADPSKNSSRFCNCNPPKGVFASLDEGLSQCMANLQHGMYE